MVRLEKALPVKRQGMAFTFFSLPIFSPYPVFLCRPCHLGRLPRWGRSGTGTGTGTTLSTPGAEPSVRGAPVPSRAEPGPQQRAPKRKPRRRDPQRVSGRAAGPGGRLRLRVPGAGGAAPPGAACGAARARSQAVLHGAVTELSYRPCFILVLFFFFFP